MARSVPSVGISAEVSDARSGLFSVDDHVALITVNDPVRRNALTASILSPEFAGRLAAARPR
jgi:enoyl-CoA hydratase/carnithine racemase